MLADFIFKILSFLRAFSLSLPLSSTNDMKIRDRIDVLYDAYYNELVLWADTILNDMGTAEDLVQDLFVALWEKGIDDRLDEKGMRSYLYSSVRNNALRLLKGRPNVVNLPDVPEAMEVWEESDTARAELIERVMSEMEKLPPRGREIIECVHLKNMKYAEVAQALGISIATVKTTLVRSLKALRAAFPDTSLLLCLFACKRARASFKKN